MIMNIIIIVDENITLTLYFFKDKKQKKPFIQRAFLPIV